MRLDEINQAVGGCIMRGHRIFVPHFRFNCFGKLFAQFNSEKDQVFVFVFIDVLKWCLLANLSVKVSQV